MNYLSFTNKLQYITSRFLITVLQITGIIFITTGLSELCICLDRRCCIHHTTLTKDHRYLFDLLLFYYLFDYAEVLHSDTTLCQRLILWRAATGTEETGYTLGGPRLPHVAENLN